MLNRNDKYQSKQRIFISSITLDIMNGDVGIELSIEFYIYSRHSTDFTMSMPIL